MLLLFVTLFVTAGICWYALRRMPASRYWSWEGSAAVFLLAAGAASIFGSFRLGQVLPKTWVHSETVQLANPWQGEDCSTAPYLLVLQRPTGEASYSWFEEGSYQPTWVLRLASEASQTQVVEEATRGTGELRLFQVQFTENPLLAWFAFSSDPTRYEFHVPLGTVRRTAL